MTSAPRIPHDKSDDTSPMAEALEKVLGSISVTTNPVVTVGVNRKVNIGNWENIDIYVALSMPVPVQDETGLKEQLAKVAEEGIAFASNETFKRYETIKALVDSPPKPKE